MSSSFVNIVFSTLKRFTQAYNIEPMKYESKGTYLLKYKGIGKYVGFVILVSYFTLLPKVF